MTSMKVTVMGSGTSTGVPVIGCDCEVCQSTDPRDNRTRTGILVTLPSGDNICIDTSPEFRLQILRAKVKSVKHVLYTHAHADHCHGFDDLRAFFFRTRDPLHLYVPALHADDFTRRFRYAFEDNAYHGIKPQVELHVFDESATLNIGGMNIETMLLEHGSTKSCSYRFGNFAFATDFKQFRPEQIERWAGQLQVLVASGIRFREHATHSSIPETIQLMQSLRVARGIISHLSHEVGHLRDAHRLPSGIELAYDGMIIDVPGCLA